MLVANIFKQMSRFMAILGLTLFALSTASAWSLFGPKNYDECILQNMKGINEQTAAQAVIISCTNKFPDRSAPQCKLRQLTSSELSLLTFKPKTWGGTSGMSAYFEADVHNGNTKIKINAVSVKLSAQNINPPQIYKTYIKGNSDSIEPLSNGNIFVPIQTLPTNNFQWSITSIETCN